LKDSKEILSSILKTTQMGQIGIRAVEQKAIRAELKQALSDQMKEYDAIESQAHDLARERGWQVEELDPGVRKMAETMTRMRLQGRNLDSKIAAMMMKGNNRGIIKGYKNIHRYHGRDPRIMALSQKLIDCESENIKQMEGFL
jgi:hypothetical protein